MPTDAKESADPVGEYTVLLHPADGTDSPRHSEWPDGEHAVEGRGIPRWILGAVRTRPIQVSGVEEHRVGNASPLRLELRQQLLHRALQVPGATALPRRLCHLWRQRGGDGVNVPSEYQLKPPRVGHVPVA